MKNKKEVIWFISKYAVSKRQGPATRQYFLSVYFSKKGFDTVLISSQSSNIKNYVRFINFFSLENESGLNHITLRGPKINLGFSIIRIWSWIVFEWNLLRLTLTGKYLKRPDVIIVSSLSILSFLTGVILKKKYKAKLILEVRDIWPLSLIEVGGLSRYNPIVLILRGIEKIGYLNADAIVGTMPNLKTHIAESIQKDVPVYYVPQGFDSDSPVSNDRVCSRLNRFDEIESKHFRIIYSGSIGKANKVDLILSAAEKLNVVNKDIMFYIMGDGPLREKYRIKYMHLDNVVFIDPIPSTDVVTFLSDFDLLIVSVGGHSIYRFGISLNKMIDYMRSARPILMSYSGFPSLIDGEKYCFTVPSDDVDALASKIIEISKMEKSILNKMGVEALTVVNEQHPFEILSNRYIEIFKGHKI